MEREQMIVGFNRWMDEYIKNPKKFLETQQSINRHLLEKADGKAPTYGEHCAMSLVYYATEPDQDIASEAESLPNVK